MDQLNRNGSSITIIHFLTQTDPERIACMPGMTEFHETLYHPVVRRTNEILAVTCPACLKKAKNA